MFSSSISLLNIVFLIISSTSKTFMFFFFMRKVIITTFCIILLHSFSFYVSAHPWRTASDGCHYCRTNCDSWWVPRNQRHCHWWSSTSSVKTTNYQTVQPKAAVLTCSAWTCKFQNQCRKLPDNAHCAIISSTEARECDAWYIESNGKCAEKEAKSTVAAKEIPATTWTATTKSSAASSTNIPNSNSTSSSTESDYSFLWVIGIGAIAYYFFKNKWAK